jgi:hypothetical protein
MSDAYDPTAPEGQPSGGSQYMSKKDVRNILLVIVVLVAGLFPVYKSMERNSEKARCVQNMKAIASALAQYATLNTDRFPSLYEKGPNGEPLTNDKGISPTWASVVSQYMSARQSFLCPSAIAEEAVAVAGMRPAPEQKLKPHPANSELLTYGMYAAYDTFPISQVDNPNSAIIVAETSNMGARDSYDPMPFKDADGKVIGADAFSINWSNSNTVPNADTQSVTRLAFYNVKDGKFDPAGDSRHSSGINALTTGGALVLLKPDSAVFSSQPGMGGRWAVPANLGR